MTLSKMLMLIAGCTLMLAVIGAAAGAGLGWGAPNYYRSVFVNGNSPNFDPLAVGIGQGLTQGAAGGALAGVAVVAILCWREVQLHRQSPKQPPA